MRDFKTDVVSVEGLNLDELNLYNPDTDMDIVPKFVVTIEKDGQESKFLCRRVSHTNVLLELPDDVAIYLDTREFDKITTDAQRLTDVRYLNQYNLTTCLLGIIKPTLSEAQLKTCLLYTSPSPRD